MSQEKIYNFLEKIEKATSQEIAEAIKVSLSAVRTSLRRMEKWEEVEKRNLNKKNIESHGIKYSGRHYIWMIKK
jgi:Mn-dependent DtxR family transcriptional regulator